MAHLFGAMMPRYVYSTSVHSSVKIDLFHLVPRENLLYQLCNHCIRVSGVFCYESRSWKCSIMEIFSFE